MLRQGVGSRSPIRRSRAAALQALSALSSSEVISISCYIYFAMPTSRHGDATIHYEELGQGFPILTFAPAGLQSTIEVWSRPAAPIDPTTEFAGTFRVIAMDQGNAGGRSRAPITAQDGWPTHTDDHIALLDHLRVERCHLYGQEFLAKHTPRA